MLGPRAVSILSAGGVVVIMLTYFFLRKHATRASISEVQQFVTNQTINQLISASSDSKQMTPDLAGP